MNRIHTTVVIAGLCAAIVGWQFWHHSPKTSSTDQVRAAASDNSKPSFESVNDEDSNDVSAQATENVLGFEVLEDRNCDIQIHYIPDAETGEIHEAMSCEPTSQEPPNPYESWDDELLAQEAYGDPVAAGVLGLRYIRSDDRAAEEIGLNLLYRSVALSGDPEVFRKAIGARYAFVSENGKPNLKNMKQLLVFSHIGSALGGPILDAAMIEQELRQHSVSEHEVLQLKKGSNRILQEMARLQTEITGSTSIREAIENV